MNSIKDTTSLYTIAKKQEQDIAELMQEIKKLKNQIDTMQVCIHRQAMTINELEEYCAKLIGLR